jgi:hypothetical protein
VQVIFTVDIRAPLDDLRETAVKDVTEAIYTICIRRGVKCEVKRMVRASANATLGYLGFATFLRSIYQDIRTLLYVSGFCRCMELRTVCVNLAPGKSSNTNLVYQIDVDS